MPCIISKKVLQLILVTTSMQLSDASGDAVYANGFSEKLKFLVGLLMALAMVMILIFMFPGGGGRPTSENTDEDLMIDGYAQLERHIVAAQVAMQLS